MIDIRLYGAVPDATTNCTTAINNALAVGDIIVQNGVFQVETEILIPSNRTIYIKNAQLFLKTNFHNNLFRNADIDNGNSNIKIIGLGNASISGNSLGHNDGYVTWGRESETTHKYYLGIFANVAGFEISGITFPDNAHWGVLFQGCSGYANGDKSVLKNIDGNMHRIVENQDIFDFGFGTHDINISNITVNINDDPWAIFATGKTGCWIRTAQTPADKRGVGDVYNLSFTNIWIKYTRYHPFVVLTGDGNKIHDISMSNWRVDACQFLCYFGLSGYYYAPPTKDDVYNIMMDNITVQAQGDTQALIKVLENCKNVTVTNLVNNTGKPSYYRDPAKIGENIYINGVLQA